MKKIILLTACIDPRGMSNTYLTDIEERKMQYVNALHFYINKTNLDIVFVENSGYDISSFFEKQINENRLEILTYKADDANRFRGKGFGEAEIIEYAISHSNKIIEPCTLIKITGRLIVDNISKIIRFYSLLLSRKTIQCNMSSDFSFADSKLIIAPLFFYEILTRNKSLMNDCEGNYFEHILAMSIKEQEKFYYSFFLENPIFLGVSGTSGVAYTNDIINTNRKIAYIKYAIKEMLSFDLKYSNKKYNIYFKLILYINYVFTSIIQKLIL
jgi:hypothetical protein